MSSLREALAGLAAVVDTIGGLHVVDHIPEDVGGYPAALIWLRGSEATSSLGGGSRAVVFSVHLLEAAVVGRKQLDLYDYVEVAGPRSVFAAVRADRTLGGLNVDANADAGSFEETDLVRLGATNVYGLTVNIPVWL